MPIPISCVCGKQFQVKDELAGRPVRCPCSRVMTVPGRPVAVAPPPVPRPASPPPPPLPRAAVRPAVPPPPPATVLPAVLPAPARGSALPVILIFSGLGVLLLGGVVVLVVLLGGFGGAP